MKRDRLPSDPYWVKKFNLPQTKSALSLDKSRSPPQGKICCQSLMPGLDADYCPQCKTYWVTYSQWMITNHQ
ncbi:MAG: hypothetical protein AAFY26_09435 [Cyanobacteria bacterium J06638_22]